VIEAIRHTGAGYVAAVQWHPEFHRPDLGTLDDVPLLTDFLQACKATKAVLSQ
jgi:putative glutamine amidotransferase